MYFNIPHTFCFRYIQKY